MKASIFKIGFSFFFMASLCVNVMYAQDKKAEVKNSIEARQFVFSAQTALPFSGSSRQLTPEYELKISKESVTSYLPYFGRSYSASYNSSDGGFKFTSVKFDFIAKPGKKGGWDISIKPKDVTDVRELSLIISENGYATLHVTSENRQPISFSGYITAIK